MVQRLLDFKAVANSIVTDVFVDQVSHPSSVSGEASTSHAGTSTNTSTANHNQFSYALIDAFQTGFKARRNKPAEMIAKYMDKAMREPNRNASDNDFAKRMDAVLALYRFTEDKDVFRTFYHRALAKRLLLGRSASDDDEKMMLKKLKERAFLRSFTIVLKLHHCDRIRSRVWYGGPYVQ
jgi:cullin 4